MGSEDMYFHDGGSKKKGFYLSNWAMLGIVFFYVGSVLLVGLLVGLVGRPTCQTEIPETPDPTTTKPPTTTTTVGVITGEPMTTAIQETTHGSDATTAPSDEGIWTNRRLPASLIPEHYVIDLRPDFDFNSEYNAYLFYGSSSVRFLCNVSTDYIILHSVELNYTDNGFTIFDEVGAEQKIIKSFFYLPNEYLVLQTEAPCQEGKMYNFTANSFQGILGDDMYGLYKSEYTNENGEKRVIAVSQMEDSGARRAFPCFDEPGLKATFDVILRHRNDQGYFAVSTMPIIAYQEMTLSNMFASSAANRTLVQDESEINGIVWNASIFNTTVIMSTYLTAFSVCDYTYVESSTQSGVEIKIYARKSFIDNGDGQYANEITPQILEILGYEFDSPYPLPKSDQLAATAFNAGAMENWGLVIYREYLLLWNPNLDTPHDKYRVTEVIAHELAHQWFGNLVTCAWWNEIWLNEGFATYVSYIGIKGVQPEWKTDEIFVVDDLQVAFRADDSSSSHALVHPEGFFSSVTYSKGGSVIRMFNSILGEPTFTQGLKNYLDKHKYGSATHDDLFDSWIEQADADGLKFPVDLREVFESWTLQMGYPYVYVDRVDQTTFLIAQKYFLIDPDDKPNYEDSEGSKKYKYKWYIPFTYKTESNVSSDEVELKWMTASSTSYDLKVGDDNYILGNIDSKGFYRVVYEQGIFNAIVKKLSEPSFEDISPQNRAQLIDDAFNIASHGLYSVKRVFNITSYMYQELSYIAWNSFLDELESYDKKLSSSSIYVDFRKHLLSLVEPSIYTEYGWDDSNTSDALLFQRYTREIAIGAACYYGSQSCLGNATELLKLWMKDPKANSIALTYRSAVYCYGIRESGWDEWNFMVGQFGVTEDGDDQQDLLYGLSCSKDPAILELYLEWSLDENNLPRNQLYSVFAYVAGHDYGKYVALAFAYNNWDRIMAITNYGSNALDNLLYYSVARLSTEFDVQLLRIFVHFRASRISSSIEKEHHAIRCELESFKSLVSDSPAWTANINSYIGAIESNMEWRSDKEQDIAEWLGSKVTLNIPTPRQRRYKAIEPDDIHNGFKRKFGKRFPNTLSLKKRQFREIMGATKYSPKR